MSESLLTSLSYITGHPPRQVEPLSRYLPPIPKGVVSSWLQKNIPKGSWVLDPFCTSPRLVAEAASAGYKVLVTANNPITRFILEMTTAPPKEDELNSALAELAASYKAEERIEPHIRSLYSTVCARCGQNISADEFHWQEGDPAPYARVYSCPHCGDSGEHPCTAFDVDRARQLAGSGLHKARALERVVATNDPDRVHVEQALSVYSPRAIYALITIVNKIEGLNVTPAGKKHLSALLLHAFDQANSMWRVPSSRERRRQLALPRHYREKNVWVALEQGIDLWISGYSDGFTLPISTWPDQPPDSGGISLYEGRMVSIADLLPALNIKAVCAAIPRPNQAFWTLSALWAGWLWGREAMGTFKSVLHRQRYDWGWHSMALVSVFKHLSNVLDPSTPIFGLIAETEPGFIASALVGAAYAGCSLSGIAIRQEENQAQILWSCQQPGEHSDNRTQLLEAGASAAKRYLEGRGEPGSYLNTISAAFAEIVQTWTHESLPYRTEKKITPGTQISRIEVDDQPEPTPSLVYTNIYNSAREGLSYRYGFLRYNLQDISSTEPSEVPPAFQESLFQLNPASTSGDDEADRLLPEADIEVAQEKERSTRSTDVSESVMLWLRDTEKVSHISISDRYELTLLNYLATHPGSTNEEIDTIMCERFPGLFTPDPEFIQICLQSYGEKELNNPEQWHLRPEDYPLERQKDIDSAYSYISLVGNHLGVATIEHGTKTATEFSWKDETGELDFLFYVTSTANIGEYIINQDQPQRSGVIILPGSRANLVIYKIRRDPRLYKAFHPESGNWQFLKFRHLKSLAENPLLNRDNFHQLFQLDPLTYTTPQLRLI